MAYERTHNSQICKGKTGERVFTIKFDILIALLYGFVSSDVK
jgi:hypothetical protein